MRRRDGGRDWSYVAVAKDHPKEARKDPPSCPCQHLDFRPPASELQILRLSATWTVVLGDSRTPGRQDTSCHTFLSNVSYVPGTVLGLAQGKTVKFRDCAGDLPPKSPNQSSCSSPLRPGGLLLQTTWQILSPGSSPREAGVSFPAGPFRKSPG